MALVTMYCIKNDELSPDPSSPLTQCNALFTLTDPDSDSDPGYISPELKSESNSVKFEKFCRVQWSHFVCSPNSRSESISESDNANKPLTLTLSVITVLCGGKRVGASTAK